MQRFCLLGCGACPQSSGSQRGSCWTGRRATNAERGASCWPKPSTWLLSSLLGMDLLELLEGRCCVYTCHKCLVGPLLVVVCLDIPWSSVSQSRPLLAPSSRRLCLWSTHATKMHSWSAPHSPPCIVLPQTHAELRGLFLGSFGSRLTLLGALGLSIYVWGVGERSKHVGWSTWGEKEEGTEERKKPLYRTKRKMFSFQTLLWKAMLNDDAISIIWVLSLEQSDVSESGFCCVLRNDRS